MNALALFSPQQMDPIGSFMQGQQARQQQTQMQNQNALAAYMQQNGAAVLAGDQNALAEIAKYDPMTALQIQGNVADMRYAANSDRRAEASLALARQEAELAGKRWAAETARLARADELAATQAELQRVGAIYEAVAARGPEAYPAMQQQFPGLLPESFDDLEIEYAQTMGAFKELGGGSADLMEVSPGATIFDPSSRAPVFTAPKAPETRVLRPGDVMVNADGSPVTSIPDAPDMPSSFQEFQLSQQDPDFGKFLLDQNRSRAASVSVNTMPNAPTGFTYITNPDGQQELRPIAGGPGEQISADIAGRIALAEDSLRQLPNLIEMARNGDLTGPADYFKGWMGRGEQGEARRDNRAASEAITRMLTGAGMNESEAAREADLYIIGPTDNAQSATNKLMQLERRLTQLLDTATRGRREGVAVDQGTGRGVAPPPAPPAAPEVPPELLNSLRQAPPGTQIVGKNGERLIWDGQSLTPAE